MYPFFEIFWMKIYMTWIWIFFSLLTFMFLIWHYWKKYSLNFWKFFNFLPLFTILPYLSWSYFYFLLELKKIVPLDVNDLMFIISPYWYHFHFIWIVLWFLVCFLLFFSYVKTKIEILKRVDVLFYSVSLSIIPLWFFLLLWDNYIWQSTNSPMWVSAFMPESELYKYGKVYPVWLYLSLVWIFSFIWTFFLHLVSKKYWIWFIWFILFFILVNIPIIFQYYPRHAVNTFLDFKFDIKNYFTVFIILFIIFYYYLLRKNSWK